MKSLLKLVVLSITLVFLTHCGGEENLSGTASNSVPVVDNGSAQEGPPLEESPLDFPQTFLVRVLDFLNLKNQIISYFDPSAPVIHSIDFQTPSCNPPVETPFTISFERNGNRSGSFVLKTCGEVVASGAVEEIGPNTMLLHFGEVPIVIKPLILTNYISLEIADHPLNDTHASN